MQYPCFRFKETSKPVDKPRASHVPTVLTRTTHICMPGHIAATCFGFQMHEVMQTVLAQRQSVLLYSSGLQGHTLNKHDQARLLIVLFKASPIFECFARHLENAPEN